MSFLYLSRRTSQVFIGRSKAPNPVRALVVLFLRLRLCNSMNNIFLRDILSNTIFFRLNMKFSFCDKEGKGATCIYLVREDNKSVGTLKKSGNGANNAICLKDYQGSYIQSLWNSSNWANVFQSSERETNRFKVLFWRELFKNGISLT